MRSRRSHLTTDSYLKQFPNEIRLRLGKIWAIIKKSAPAAEERISYQLPACLITKMVKHRIKANLEKAKKTK